MKTHVDKEAFVNTFDSYGRGNNFSRAAREALFEYFEQLEENTGGEIEFDCIAICCDWSEYKSQIGAVAEYVSFDDFTSNYDGDKDKCLEYLRDNTQVIEFEGGILVQSF